MSMFKNRLTGDVTSVFGPIHDNYVLRADEELIFDDRDAQRDPLTEPLDVPVDEPVTEAAEEAAPDPSDKAPEVSQKSTTRTDADGVGNPKE